MLYIDTRIVDSSEAILAEGAQVTQEGQAMVAVPGKGISPSTGAANEIFAGFAMNQLCGIPVLEPYGIAVEEFLVDSSTKVTVQFAPISNNSVALINLESGKKIASPTVTGKTIAATTMTTGMKVKVVYRYALTNIQARAMMGDAQPGGPAGAIVGQCGLAKRGIIYTSCFDTSVNWAAATAIKLASGGFVTDSGIGTALTGAYVVKVPTAEIPFLGIEFSAA